MARPASIVNIYHKSGQKVLSETTTHVACEAIDGLTPADTQNLLSTFRQKYRGLHRDHYAREVINGVELPPRWATGYETRKREVLK